MVQRQLITFCVMAFISLNSFADDPPASTPDGNTATSAFQPGKGLEIHSADKAFKLNIKLFAHVLYTATGGTGPLSTTKTRDIDNYQQSFEVRRARLVFSGNFFGEHNQYYVQLAFSPKDMQFKNGAPSKSPIFDWYFKFDYLRDLTLQVGQYRIPYSKQRQLPYANLQFIDRSLGNFEFNLDRDIGCDLRSDDFLGLGLLRYRVGVFIGEGRDGVAATDFGMLYVARVELLPLGIYKDNSEADLERRVKPGLAIGAAYAFAHDAKRDRGILGNAPDDEGATDIHNATVDIALKVAGISVFSEFYMRQGWRHYGDGTVIDDVTGDEIPAPHTPPRNALGWFGQLGYVLPWAPLEPVFRYSQVHPYRTDTSIGDRVDEVGGGLNWYIEGSAMALKADYHHRFSGGDLGDGTHELRLSFQAGF